MEKFVSRIIKMANIWKWGWHFCRKRHTNWNWWLWHRYYVQAWLGWFQSCFCIFRVLNYLSWLETLNSVEFFQLWRYLNSHFFFHTCRHRKSQSCSHSLYPPSNPSIQLWWLQDFPYSSLALARIFREKHRAIDAGSIGVVCFTGDQVGKENSPLGRWSRVICPSYTSWKLGNQKSRKHCAGRV